MLLRGETSKPNVDYTKETGVFLDLENPATLALLQKIDVAGGMVPYSDFMQEALYGENGFYATGKAKIEHESGDFITHPAASSLFGASIAQGAYAIWQKMGSPQVFSFVEMGAGKGHLAKALIDYVEKEYPDFYKSLRYTILEYSKGLIPQQIEHVKHHTKINWIRGNAQEIPFANLEGLIVSNELPDAFPIERVKNINGTLVQCYVGEKNGLWVEHWKTPTTEVLAHINTFGITVEEGREMPINLRAAAFQEQVAQSLQKGAVITIDYGSDGLASTEKSTRFYYQDKKGNKIRGSFPEEAEYKHLGKIDITADVDFSILKSVGTKNGMDIVLNDSEQKMHAIFGAEIPLLEALEKFKTQKMPWRTLVEMAQQVVLGCFFVFGTKNYHSLIMSKNLDSPTTVFDDIPQITYSEIGERIGATSISKLLQTSGKTREEIITAQANLLTRITTKAAAPQFRFSRLRKPDEAQFVSINPDGTLDMEDASPVNSVYLAGVINLAEINTKVVIDGSGNIIYDFRNEDDIKEFAQSNGYSWE